MSTAYYLPHRHAFGLDESPVGACIVYATACGLSDLELDKTWDVLLHAYSQSKLKVWNQRRSKGMGYEAPSGKTMPLLFQNEGDE